MVFAHLREALVALGWVFVVPCAIVAACIGVALTFGVAYFVPAFLVLAAGSVKVLNRPT